MFLGGTGGHHISVLQLIQGTYNIRSSSPLWVYGYFFQLCLMIAFFFFFPHKNKQVNETRVNSVNV